jgi:hypothetical protein
MDELGEKVNSGEKGGLCAQLYRIRGRVNAMARA